MPQPSRPPGLSTPADLLAAHGDGKVTRREIADGMGEAVGFGRFLSELHQAGLALPRIPSDCNSAGLRRIEDLTERAMARAG